MEDKGGGLLVQSTAETQLGAGSGGTSTAGVSRHQVASPGDCAVRFTCRSMTSGEGHGCGRAGLL